MIDGSGSVRTNLGGISVKVISDRSLKATHKMVQNIVLFLTNYGTAHVHNKKILTCKENKDA